MELFDLEIPIRSTGLDATREDFRALERQGTESAAKVERALGTMAPPPRVAEGFKQATVTAQQTTASVEGLGRAATETAAANQSLAMQQTKVAQGLQEIAAELLQAKAAFDSDLISVEGLTGAVEDLQAQAIALVGGLKLSGEQAASFKSILETTATALAEADSAMKLILTDVTRVSADFKAGTISAEEYAAAMRLSRAQAIELSQGMQLAGADLSAFNRILRTTNPAAGSARQGLGTMRSSMLSLAATMVGTRSTLGTLAGALLQFSIGNPLAVGVSAGILGLVVLYEKLTDKTREAKEATDKLIESLRKERDERIAAEHPELPFQASTEQLRKAQADLQAKLDTALKGEAVSGGTGGRGTTIVNQKRVAELRAQIKDLDTLQLEALRRENAAQKTLTESRRADLIALVTAGTATKQEEADLRAEYSFTKQALGEMTAAERGTAEGRTKAATLTEHLTAIEGAFQKQAKATGKAVTDAAKALEARTQALIALQGLEGPTADRWQALTDRAATLRQELDAGNLTLDQRVAKLRELKDIEASTGFGEVDQFEKIKTRGPDIARTPGPLMTVQPAAPQIPGGKGSLFGGLVSQITEDGTSVTDAITEVEGNISAAAAELGATFADALTNSIKTAASGGGIGNAIKGLIGSMMAAFGQMAIKFGVAAIAVSTLIKRILDSLRHLNPVLAIAAGAALVALGTALLSQNAEKSFGGGGGGTQPINTTVSVGSSSSAPRTGTASSVRIATASPATSGEAGTATGPATGMAELSLGASVAGASGATGLRSAVGVSANLSRPAIGSPQPASVPLSTVTTSVRTLQPIQQTTFQFTVVGANDPAAQRQIVKMVNAGLARGAA